MPIATSTTADASTINRGPTDDENSNQNIIAELSTVAAKTSSNFSQATTLLNTFQQRLEQLQLKTLPLISSTQKLNRLQSNLQKSIEEYQRVMKYFDFENRELFELRQSEVFIKLNNIQCPNESKVLKDKIAAGVKKIETDYKKDFEALLSEKISWDLSRLHQLQKDDYAQLLKLQIKENEEILKRLLASNDYCLKLLNEYDLPIDLNEIKLKSLKLFNEKFLVHLRSSLLQNDTRMISENSYSKGTTLLNLYTQTIQFLVKTESYLLTITKSSALAVSSTTKNLLSDFQGLLMELLGKMKQVGTFNFLLFDWLEILLLNQVCVFNCFYLLLDKPTQFE
jgi:hypothetical protein